jgi:hypothetical protein
VSPVTRIPDADFPDPDSIVTAPFRFLSKRVFGYN